MQPRRTLRDDKIKQKDKCYGHVSLEPLFTLKFYIIVNFNRRGLTIFIKICIHKFLCISTSVVLLVVAA